MNVCDTPSQVILRGKPFTKWIKNSDAKMIIAMLLHTGMAKESEIELIYDKNHPLDD